MKLLADRRKVTAVAKNPELSGDLINLLLSQLAGAEVSQKYTATSGHPFWKILLYKFVYLGKVAQVPIPASQYHTDFFIWFNVYSSR